MDNIELKRFWEKVKEEYVGILPESVHPWIYSLEVSGYDKGVLTVVTGQAMARDWLRKYHSEQMNKTLKTITKNEAACIHIIYDENEARKMKKEVEKIHKKELELQQKEQAIENLSYMQSSSNLNLKYKFENFVVGENNKFAHSAALAVAKNPAQKYNPLFIYGKAGLGKTHLMQAIGHYTIFNNPKAKVKYTKTDDYINDFISNSRKSNDYVENMAKFNKKYTNIDIILIDDIQFIESKERTMERMQHTFDTLYNKGKQIVITSDRIPEEIPKLTDALKTRFEWGLMVELIPPEIETRIKILKNLAQNCGIEAEQAALKYIAENYDKNVRELEGAFTKVCAFAEMSEQKITLNLAQQILKCKPAEAVSFDSVAKITAEYLNVDVDDIKGTSRNQKVVKARQLIFYLCRELTNQSFESIGEYFNKKHTTAMYGHEQVKNKINASQELSNAVREIKQALKVIR
jgi:chromosomal replication initiator protein